MTQQQQFLQLVKVTQRIKQHTVFYLKRLLNA